MLTLLYKYSRVETRFSRLGYFTFPFVRMGISLSMRVRILRFYLHYIHEVIFLHRRLRIILFQLATNLDFLETSDSILSLM